SILWDNSAYTGTTIAPQLDSDSAIITLTYCDVQDCSACGSNDIGSDPVFVNPSTSNFRLQSTSPCKDSGNNTPTTQAGITADLDGSTRILFSVVDRGSYEFSAAITDCNQNGIPDACDLNCAASGCSSYAGRCGTEHDCNTNGIPDSCDIAAGAQDCG